MSAPAFTPIPLGQSIPPLPHAVSCSLPTMRDVIGYEEKDPAVTRHLNSGYPRFVVHPFVRQLTAHLVGAHGLGERELWLTHSARMADDLLAWLDEPAATRFATDDLWGVSHPPSASLSSRAKTCLQNAGGFLSSRAAEDHLARLGLIPAIEPETLAPASTARATVDAVMARAYPETHDTDRFYTPNGMNAFFAGWRASATLQARRGRTIWIQLGWLYLDTIALLRRLTASPTDYIYLRDVNDLDALAAACAAAGDRLAGLVTEAPTNPLVQTADLAAAAELVHARGGHVIIDPTLVSPFNVDVLGPADLLTNSLTKYAASEGDLVAGAVIVNPARPDASALRDALASTVDPIYARDFARLAAEIGDFEQVIARTNDNAARVIEFLQGHPGVAELYWSQQPGMAANYAKIARGPSAIGSIISFRVRGPLAPFYDRLNLPKGPSFGMKTTLICPFIFLAHYNLVTSAEGQAELAASGLHPELLRLAVGCEDPAAIIASLADAFEAVR